MRSTLKRSEYATTTSSDKQLLEQYDCGPVQVMGTADALYDLHVFFDNAGTYRRAYANLPALLAGQQSVQTSQEVTR
jgi:hypothetical protein